MIKMSKILFYMINFRIFALYLTKIDNNDK